VGLGPRAVSDEQREIPPIPCEECGAEMEIAHVTPKARSFPELVTFWCRECGHFHAIEREED
jgi:uncharacterized Zn finger protein